MSNIPRTWTLEAYSAGPMGGPEFRGRVEVIDAELGKLKAQIETFRKRANSEHEQMLDVLEHLYRNAEHIFAKQPVRDWGETLAESAALLRKHGRL